MTVTEIPEEKKKFKHKKAVIAVSAVLVFVITLISTFFIIIKVGEVRLRKNLVSGENLQNISDEYDENAVYLNGKAYYYNDDLINILLIGVDRKALNKDSLGQADALYLASINTEENTVKIFSISRNTVTRIDIYSSSGEVYGSEEKQICLAYSYGSTDEKSSQNCVNAVSNLLYGIPINEFYTMHMDSLEYVVDAVGGVEVTIPENAQDPMFSGKLGQTVVLDGWESLAYLRMRGDSNGPRVEHHKAFIKSFVTSAKSAVKKDLTLPFKIANNIKKDSVTSMDITSAVYLATEALDWKLEFVNIAGEYGFDGEYETFVADESKLRQTVLDNFYIPQEQVESAK